MLYNILTLLHVILFAYWLGGDLGVFYASRSVTNPDLGREARSIATRIMLAVDLSPRICMVLILPVGIHMAVIRNQLMLSDTTVISIWLAALFWLLLVLCVHFVPASRAAEALRRVDFSFRLLVIAVTVGLALWQLVAPAQIQADWIALKLLIFGILVACGLAIRIALRPFGPAFASLLEQGSTPTTEAAIQRSLGRARPFVLAIWTGLVISAVLGVFQSPV